VTETSEVKNSLLKIQSLSEFDEHNVDYSEAENNSVGMLPCISDNRCSRSLTYSVGLLVGSIIFPADSLPDYSSLRLSKEDVEKKCADLELKNVLLLQQVFELSRQLEAVNNASNSVNSANIALAGIHVGELPAGVPTLSLPTGRSFATDALSSPVGLDISPRADPTPTSLQLSPSNASVGGMDSREIREKIEILQHQVRAYEERMHRDQVEIARLNGANQELHTSLGALSQNLQSTSEARRKLESEFDALHATVTLCCDKDELISQRLLDVYQTLKTQVTIEVDEISASPSREDSSEVLSRYDAHPHLHVTFQFNVM
jgi:prefoldin subunit 5